LVYSSDEGWEIPEPPLKVRMHPQKPQSPHDGVIRVSRERRRASTVTLITGLRPGEVQNVARTLKTSCGTGGTTKNGIVELQGDQRDKAIAFFEKQNRRVKRAGG